MKCAWQAYLRLLPGWMRKDVDEWGRERLQELRLRVDKPPELVLSDQTIYLMKPVSSDDMQFCINVASQYSPWTSSTLSYGYITAQGGHRIGICGSIAIINGHISTIRDVTSLCIRVARDFHNLADDVIPLAGSILVIGKPGSGKTTLLRDLARGISNSRHGTVAVVDERGELFPAVNGKFCFPIGKRMDVLSGCSKASGIEMMVRTMRPDWVAVDEITSPEDCQALIQAGWCGVSILATAHAGSMNEFMKRPVYKSLIQCGLFDHYLIMRNDKTWLLERVDQCIQK